MSFNWSFDNTFIIHTWFEIKIAFYKCIFLRSQEEEVWQLLHLDITYGGNFTHLDSSGQFGRVVSHDYLGRVILCIIWFIKQHQGWGFCCDWIFKLKKFNPHFKQKSKSKFVFPCPCICVCRSLYNSCDPFSILDIKYFR